MVSSTYKGYRFLQEIISHCVWLYHRSPCRFATSDCCGQAWDRGDLRDDPRLVRPVRARVRPPASAECIPSRLQVAPRRSVRHNQCSPKVPVAGGRSVRNVLAILIQGKRNCPRRRRDESRHWAARLYRRHGTSIGSLDEKIRPSIVPPVGPMIVGPMIVRMLGTWLSGLGHQRSPSSEYVRTTRSARSGRTLAVPIDVKCADVR